MKQVTWDREGFLVTMWYDPNAPCWVCGLPVVDASLGGNVVCPWCFENKCRTCGGPVETLTAKDHAETHPFDPMWWSS